MNWRLWWQWAVEHNARGLGLLFITLGVTPPVVLPLIGRRLYISARFLQKCRIEGWQILLCIALYILGDFTKEWMELVANIDSPRGMASGGIHYGDWFAWWYWTGKAIKLSSVLLLAWAVLIREKDDKEELRDAARRLDGER